MCRKAMVSRRQAQQRSKGKARIDPASILICDGCQRCFHEKCAEKAGIDVAGGETRDGWFHTPGCRRAHEVLGEQVRGARGREGDKGGTDVECWGEAPSSNAGTCADPLTSCPHHSSAHAQARMGDTPLAGGRSLEVVACRDLPDKPQRKALRHLIDVLAPAYGPAIVEQVRAR